MIAVVDIDGVLADATHREHHLQSRPKDWESFFADVGDDGLIVRGRDLVTGLSTTHAVVLLSGRPERTRADTVAWLERHGIAYSRLILRADHDHRRAADLKAELVQALAAPAEVAVVVDDDATVVDTLGRLGYRTLLFQ